MNSSLLRTPLVCLFLFTPYEPTLSGGAGDKGQDDGVRHHHGQLPTAGGQGQLFPHGDLESRGDLRGHRLSYRGDRAAGPGSIRLVSANPPLLFPLAGELFVVNVLVNYLFSLFPPKVTYLRVYLRGEKKIYVYNVL